jgi:hypothetical protein
LFVYEHSKFMFAFCSEFDTINRRSRHKYYVAASYYVRDNVYYCRI